MFATKQIPYSQTNSFTQITNDYLRAAEALRPFYDQSPNLEGIKRKIEERKQFATDRAQLVEVLQEQYKNLPKTYQVTKNIESLLHPNTFTIVTAHQPNLFTGPLYFIYKILHAIKLANHLQQQLPENQFVPVYYMGSEDADFAELNHTWVDGKKLEWKKEQKGAVGRMVVDKTLVQLIDDLEGQLGVEAQGKEVVQMLRQAYIPGKTIQAATFELLNELYGAFGLVILIPDHPKLKAQLHCIFNEDLFHHQPLQIVERTSAKLSETYTAQAFPREINLFYLKGDIRERIEERDGQFYVLNTDLKFTRSELEEELKSYPERFSPNVILRGIYQETILPNIAFVGGGGELAYWLQLKDLFGHYNVPYPVLVLRNSFLVVEKKWQKKIDQLNLSIEDLFLSQDELFTRIVKNRAENPVSLNGNLEKATELYENIKAQAGKIDQTLMRHVTAMQARSLSALQELEKKMLRAEKRKFSDVQRQVEKIKAALFPNNGLQERVENFSLFYAKWGRSFIDELYQHSLALEQEFTVLTENS